jgi:hypothetical protein
MEELHTDSIDGGHEASYGARSRARERAYSNNQELKDVFFSKQRKGFVLRPATTAPSLRPLLAPRCSDTPAATGRALVDDTAVETTERGGTLSSPSQPEPTHWARHYLLVLKSSWRKYVTIQSE